MGTCACLMKDQTIPLCVAEPRRGEHPEYMRAEVACIASLCGKPTQRHPAAASRTHCPIRVLACDAPELILAKLRQDHLIEYICMSRAYYRSSERGCHTNGMSKPPRLSLWLASLNCITYSLNETYCMDNDTFLTIIDPI